MSLPVVARSPEVLFGRAVARVQTLDFIAEIRRARQIRAGGVEHRHDARQNFAGDAVRGGQLVRAQKRSVEEQLVALVVAAPDRERRMVAARLDDLFRFPPDRVEKLFRLRCRFTCEHEVLPDHQAELVAILEKVVVFVNASAPAADHVASEIGEKIKVFSYAFRRFAVNGVGGNPVRPLDENGASVDDELEFSLHFAVQHFGAVQHKRAQTDLLDAGVDDFAVADEIKLNGVEILFAGAARMPEIGVFEIRPLPARSEIERKCLLYLLVATGQRHPRFVADQRFAVGGETPGEAQLGFLLRGFRGCKIKIGPAFRFQHFETDRTPQPRADQTRRDVPAVGVHRTAQEESLVVELLRFAVRRHGELTREIDRAADLHDEFVALRLQFRRIERETERNHHIVRPAQFFPVQEYFGNRIDAFKDQLKLFARLKLRRGKCRLVFPVDEFIRTQFVRIVRPVRIRNHVCAMQISQNISRNLRRNCSHRVVGRLLVGEGPRTCQADFCHFQIAPFNLRKISFQQIL